MNKKEMTAEMQDEIYFSLTDNSMDLCEINEKIAEITGVASVKLVDDKIDDGISEEDSDDEYVMKASFLPEGYSTYVDVYYGNNTCIIGYVGFTNV